MHASPAPVNPPIKLCDSLDGIPKYHVRTPHAETPNIPALSALNAVSYGTLVKSTMSCIVYATAFKIKKANRTPNILHIAAIIKAYKGLIDLVEIHVAIALGASVHPLTKTTPKTSIKHRDNIGYSTSNVNKSLILIKDNYKDLSQSVPSILCLSLNKNNNIE